MEVKAMIDDISTDITEVTECFYQNREHDGYQKLTDTITKFSGLIGQLMSLRGTEGQNDEDSRLLEIISEAMAALEQKDTILLSDILQYDLMEQLETIKEHIK